MKLGIVEFCLQTRSADPLVLFETARRLGLHGIEIAVTRADLREGKRLSQLRAAQEATGLHIPSLLLTEHNSGGLADTDPSVAESAAEDVRQVVDWAAELGAKIILIPFFGRNEIVTSDDVDRAAREFRPLVEAAAERGITLCYEGTLPAAGVRRMAEAVDSAAFGCYFDLANAIDGGMDAATEILTLGSLIQQVHVKDIRVRGGDCALGHGSVDFAGCAAALRQVGYNGWLVLETPRQLPELVGCEVSYVRRRFPQVAIDLPWPQIGAFTYALDDKGDDPIGKVIDQCQRFGLKSVQIGLACLDVVLNDSANAPAVRRRFESNGITINSIAGYRNLISPNLEKRRANIDFIKRCLEVAPLLGTSVVATETGTLHPTSDWTGTHANRSADAWSAFHDALDELLETARSTQTILALEGYVNNVLATQSQLAGVLERYPTQHLQVMLDPYNYLSSHLIPAQERLTLEFLHRFESHFVIAHLKDVAGVGAEIDTPEFGLGVFPQKLYLDYLRSSRPDLPLVLEHLPAAHVPAVLQRVNSLIG